MEISELKVGRSYRAKRPRAVHTLSGSFINDRQILYISLWDEIIQYDSPSVKFGSSYRNISIEAFLNWADKDVTDELPKGEWERYSSLKRKPR